MAADEARALLDALMGGDRNAPLPKGAAIPVPKTKRKSGSTSSSLLLPGKRHKSCFDSDICPLYCAWGVDVYELFVNTKSDIGPNPYVVDDGARQEFLDLPQDQQDKLGYRYFLFQKLQELVRSCDRTVQRNKEKLSQELQRQYVKRGGHDYVKDIDVGMVEQLARSQIQVDEREQHVQELLDELESIQQEEFNLKQKLEPLLQEEKQEKEAQKEQAAAAAAEGEEKEAETTTAAPVKQEDKAEATPPPAESDKKEQESAADDTADKVKQEEQPPNKENSNNDSQSLQTQLGQLTMRKQRVLYDACQELYALGPLRESRDHLDRTIRLVKSDITSDKTVCEVSGNYMSARDADERIAAHYAGKQYVGWKLVRDEYQRLTKQYGRYGPPPPTSRPGSRDAGGAPLQSSQGPHGSRDRPSRPRYNSGGSTHAGDHSRPRRYSEGPGGGAGGGYHGGSSSRGVGDRRRGAGRPRSPSPPHWERGGGGYDRGRRGGTSHRSGGGGGGGGSRWRR